MTQSYVNDSTKGFKIYLHEKEQFWPGLEMERIGQSKSIYIPTKTKVWGTFTAAQIINIDKKSAPCVTDASYSYTRCVKNYVASTAGCHLDWADQGQGIDVGVDFDRCETPDQVLRYHSVLASVR